MDHAMASLGDGIFQKITVFIVVPTAVLTTLYSEVIPYLTKFPEFLCKGPEFENENLYHKCSYTRDLCSSKIDFMKDYSSSVHNWSYSFNLFCSRESYIPILSTSYFLGGVIGCVAFSKLPDIYGRKRPFQIAIVVSFILHINLLFAVGPVHGIITFLFGGFSTFAYSMESYIVSEYLPPSKTGTIMGITNCSYPTFGIFTGLFFLLINNWRLLFLVTTIINGVVAFCVIRYFTESPRWLIANGRKEECVEVMRNISQLNGTTKDLEAFLKNNKNVFEGNNFNSKASNKGNHYSLTEILSFQSQRKNFLVLSFLWFSSCYCFYGIILNLGRMKGDFFSISIMAFAGEGVCELLTGYVSGIFGRLSLMKYGAYSGSIGFIFYLILPKSLGSICMFISMGGFAACFNVLYIYSPEVFPTPIRGTCCNILFLLSRISPLFVSPLTSLLGNNIDYVFVIFGLVGGFSCNFLKETLGVPLSDEIPEEIGKGDGLLSALSSFKSHDEAFDVIGSFKSQKESFFLKSRILA